MQSDGRSHTPASAASAKRTGTYQQLPEPTAMIKWGGLLELIFIQAQQSRPWDVWEDTNELPTADTDLEVFQCSSADAIMNTHASQAAAVC